MTILITSYRSDRILFCSDRYRYLMNMSILNKALVDGYRFNHKNFKESVVGIKKDLPKIHKIGKAIGIMYGGDLVAEKEESLLQNLDKENMIFELDRRLQQRKYIPSSFNFYVGRFDEERQICILDYLQYHNGEVLRRDRYIQGNLRFITSFSQEIVDIFQEYGRRIINSETETQISILEDFFSTITGLYNGDAGGKPIFATIDKEGFKWIKK